LLLLGGDRREPLPPQHEHVRLLARRQRRPLVRWLARRSETLGPCDDPRERLPPDLRGPLRETRADIDGERRAMLPEDRQRELEIVAVAVVEGDRDPASSTARASDKLVHRDEAPALLHEVAEESIEEFRGDREQRIRVEAAYLRPHMVERDDEAA